MQETEEKWVWSLGRGDPLEEGHDNPLQHLFMDNPMDRETEGHSSQDRKESDTTEATYHTQGSLKNWLSSAIATEERQVILESQGIQVPPDWSQLCYGCEQGGSKLAQNPAVTLVPRKGVIWNQLRSQPLKTPVVEGNLYDGWRPNTSQSQRALWSAWRPWVICETSDLREKPSSYILE